MYLMTTTCHHQHRRRYETAMHRFFRDVRVHKRKEFFAATADDVHRFFDMVAGGDDDEYGELWRELVGC